ncbi:monovalent cation/H+ antiporter subunit A [Ramlibacter tataouinensis]|uniref:Candidate NADH:ubiquinone oxidoreductase subunit 5, chain L n=1 Tax=Ramlibacter tataouinensis (strain ATCC BAA-407 / DSM 14655 / LMG 21543 / TTB310) TaxID=365046 RepID=F5XWC1_RAMTT|nr:monovalent cation/H+ antiporter subunit A [Ramlibacter tataouinensis]AEG91691.1 Candidate NADH:ubiquinone oxidoreductase subunit 5, chain L [Ramlibacter tataouinensis TTB310]
MPDEKLLIVLLLLPFVGSVATVVLSSRARDAAAWVSAGASLLALAGAASLYGRMNTGDVVRLKMPWVPTAGLEFTLRMDGLAWMFCMLVTGIGFLVVLYARYYMSPRDPIARFFAFFLAFMGSMLGVVLSGNLFQLVFFWELTSLFSFLLIGYWHHNPAARDGARMALIITSAGGLSLFAGVLLLGRIAGSYDLDAVLLAGDRIRAHSLYVPALILIAGGALTKSAQFPFHFWLPQAMAAPTPVSAYLHSAAMVKLGVFLLVRLWPALAGTDAWTWVIGTAGLVTLVLGAYVAIFQHDLKGLLAYSTASHLGLITALLGLNSPLALVAAVFHVMNHATFKASLFMAAGIIDHESGTRDIRRLSGLYRFMPVTATLAMVAAAAMAGVPLLNGFLSKEMFFSESLRAQGPVQAINSVLPVIATAWGMFSVAYSLRFIHGVFFGPAPTGLPRTPHEPPRWMRLPIEFLVLACLVVGILPTLTIGPVLDIAIRSVLGDQVPPYSLAVWHGLTVPLMMSLLALGGGAVLYRVLQRYFARGQDRTPLLPSIQGRHVFDSLLAAVSWRWARAIERAIGTRRLQPQLGLLILFALAAGLWPVWARGLHFGALLPTDADTAFLLIWIVGVACAIGAAWQAKFHRLVAIVLASGAGLVVCLTFAWLSAPDLALTQLLVEIVTSILLLLGLRWLPQRMPFRRSAAATRAALPRRARDLALAIGGGAGLGLVAYAVMTRPLPDGTVSRFFLENAWPLGGGTNVVNVIIVDFRGFDTLGEISVLCVVAITVYSLLRRFRPAPESIAPLAQRAGQTGVTKGEDLAIPAIIMRWMLPAISLVALYLLLRGHNLPGGGFAAGITMTVGLILQYMAGGTRWAEDRLPIRPLSWMMAGLLLAVGTGVGSWLFGYPFLTSHVAHFEVPLLGELHVPSAFFFDLGVFFLVVGAAALLLIALGHQSTRAHRSAERR